MILFLFLGDAATPAQWRDGAGATPWALAAAELVWGASEGQTWGV